MIGYICSRLHLLGARIEIMIGVMILCFFYGTLAFKNKYEKWKIYTRSSRDAFFLSLFDFLGIGALLLGILFKFQHWPFADLIGTIGLIVLSIGMIAWNQKFKKEVVFRKETEDLLKISHDKIEEKQKEIVDSINYAKRIQYALLAHSELLKTNLPDHFVLFKPKDIVSGDFYWATKKDDRFYLAVCDSTGHGVPGAFMSLLNISFLNEAINERNIIEPHEILNHVRKRLIENISQDGGQDGMDAVLICINKTDNTICYSAAHNSPLLIKGKDLISLGADKMPVGKGIKADSFTLKTIDWQQGDMLYLYTDGYADQFGGEKGKKFKYKQLHELLITLNNRTSEEQKNILNTSIKNWKGELEQVDDICIIGIKL